MAASDTQGSPHARAEDVEVGGQRGREALDRLRNAIGRVDLVPRWRGQHVPIKQLVDDFGRYLYLPRLRQSAVLLDAVREGLRLLTWMQDSFAYADGFDDQAGRCRGLRCGQMVNVTEDNLTGLLVQAGPAKAQLDAETGSVRTGPEPTGPGVPGTPDGGLSAGEGTGPTSSVRAQEPKRFHGTVTLETARVGRDAGRVADEVIAHLAGLVAASVKVTLDIEADIPQGTPDNVVRTVTENSRTLQFTSHGFEAGDLSPSRMPRCACPKSSLNG